MIWGHDQKYGAEQIEEAVEKELLQQIEHLEKRIQRLEHHSFIQQEDTTWDQIVESGSESDFKAEINNPIVTVSTIFVDIFLFFP